MEEEGRDSNVAATAAFHRVRFVLVAPGHPGNIGAAARAVKTMGFSRLALVAPKKFPDREDDAMASGAHDILASASRHPTLDEALAGARLSIAFTARRRDLALPYLEAREAADLLAAEARPGDVALVFGNETFGLSNDEVLRCHRIAYIDANPDYSSLNLAAAVQVMAYEVRKALRGGPESTALADAVSHEDAEHFYARLERLLVARGHLDPTEPRRLMERLRALFGRARLTRTEVDLLHGVLEALEK
ncbi:MAG: RNA methyltransferase [Burkholderiales bacterium]